MDLEGHAREEFREVMEDVGAFAGAGVSFESWVEGQVRRTSRTRTPFGFYCKSAIIGCRGGRCGSPSTALFPIPLPSLAIWTSACGKGKKARFSRACLKLLHLALLALNYEYLGKPLGALHLLRRPPAVHHIKVYGRLLGFIKASATIENLSFLGCGRKSFQFLARLNELAGVLAKFGASASMGYGGGLSGSKVDLENEAFDELTPYTSLEPSRLKLTGRGQWHCEDFLGDIFWMVFQEPRVNRFTLSPPEGLVPDLSKEEPMKIFGLCRVWDRQQLLRLCPLDLLDEERELASRIFNCRKNKDTDRQIGDRRAANLCEGRLTGDSKLLPAGPTILQLCPRRFRELLVGAVTDRRDFYHQMAVSWERSTTNFLLPGFPAGDFRDMGAYAELVKDFGKKKSGGREAFGDYLGDRGALPETRGGLLVEDSSLVVPCFASMFQGDHLGVELASEAHAGMLSSEGLLQEASRLRADRALVKDEVVQGLYIDDFFVVSREDVSSWSEGGGVSGASEVFYKAKEIYAQQGVIGSDDKDILDQLTFRVVGSEVDSRLELVRQGLVSCGLPAEKRLVLAWVASIVACLPYTTDAVHSSLVGSLVAMLMFRRPAMSCLQEVFKVIPPDELDTQLPVLRPLPRRAAQELAIVSALAPILASNLAAPAPDTVYATDASMAMGGIVSKPIAPSVSLFLWRDADKRGANLPLQPRSTAFLQKYDPMHEDVGGDPNDEEEGKDVREVDRPIGLMFDFVEICGGSGVVTAELCRLGARCGPIFDITFSQKYDLTDLRIISWCITMMEQGRLLAFLVAPPCTTFSPAAFPPLRSYDCPEGFDVHHPRVELGNRLAFASICLLMVALRMRVHGLGEQPRRSKMRWLRQWKRLLELGAKEVWTASCSFGSPHQKELCFCSSYMDVSALHKPCTRDHPHIPIQGAWTKPSAVYTPGLATALAQCFYAHLKARDAALSRLDLTVLGLEDQITNDLCLGGGWSEHSKWRWKGHSHVNILEAAATVKLFRDIAKQGGDPQVLYFGDSHVARSSLARGRTSSVALRPILKQASSICLAYGLYPAGRYAPTRWNPADHPTRGTQLQEAVSNSILKNIDLVDLSWIACLPKLRRWASNWVRLCLLIAPGLIKLSSSPGSLRRHASSIVAQQDWILDFDATLGFPGEGPLFVLPFLCLLSPGLSLYRGFMISWLALLPICHGAPRADNPGDEMRQRARRGIVLGTGRPVLETTKAHREDLFALFSGWLFEKGYDYEATFCASPFDLDLINRVLTEYGRELFDAGKPFYHYCETLNSITSRRPLLRRSIGMAWDLAFLWGSHEPAEHHAAVPHQILLAILAVSLMWGWVREAACFSLAFGALLRIGEVTGAYRRDLVLPSDVRNTMKHILLRIQEPKTRLRAAKHQVGKMEQPDLILIAELGFQNLGREEKLWPLSAATLRQRLEKVLQRLALPFRLGDRPKPLTLASFRAGGATWLITQCESSEVVRRRGRWCSLRTMEIYIQEVMAETYINDISDKSRRLVLLAASKFLEVLSKACSFSASHLPPKTWVYLFQADHK